MSIIRNKPAVAAEIRDYVFIAIGMISYSIGWNIFLLPSEITPSGLSGISSILLWAAGIPPQATFFCVNIVLLAAAFRILGQRFCVKTVYAVVVVTALTTVFRQTAGDGHLLAGQPFMAAVIGAVFCGCGVGMGLTFNGSTGGTDIVAAIVNKYRNISLGRVIMLFDVVIVTSSYMVLHDWEKVLYGYVVLYVQAFCIDQVVEKRRRSVQFFIISDKYEEIGRRINRTPRRGCTVIDASGFYSGRPVKMLFVLAKQRESDVIFRLIDEIDPHAFVSQSAVIGAYGNGFDKLKVRRHGKKEPQPAAGTAGPHACTALPHASTDVATAPDGQTKHQQQCQQ